MTCPSCRAENDEQAASCFSCGASLGPSPSSVSLGSVIAGRYEILALLGRGGMGVVYKAHDRTLDETVALKLLRPEVAGRPEMAQRFRSEIKLARKVRHENVCGIHEYGEDGRLRYIALEFVEGVNLRDLLRERGGLTQREAFELAIQAAHGLQAVHDAGIIHRDLKTSNIMRDAQGLVRLMDFGIAKQQGSDATIAGRVVGTPEYMSPEQARGKPLDTRSDVYALGVVIYELFTGRVPFKADTPVSTALKHLHEPPPLSGPGAERLPASLVPVLRRALAKQPDERPATARELAGELEEARSAAGFAPLAPSQVSVTRPSASTLVLALDEQGAERAGPTLVELARDETDVTATREGLTATRLNLPAPPGPAPGDRAPRATPGRAGRLALLGAAVLVIVALGVGLINRPPPPPPASAAPSKVPALATPEPPQETVPSLAPLVPLAPRETPIAASDRLSAGVKHTQAGTDPPLASPTPKPPSPSVFPEPPSNAQEAALEVVPASPPPEPVAPPILLPLSAVAPVADPGNRPPEYPEALRAQGVGGTVLLKIALSATGTVEDVQVLSGNRALAEAAVEAARGWRYSPALVEGRPTAVYFVVRLPFRGRER